MIYLQIILYEVIIINTVGDYIKNVRKEKKITSRKLAELSQVSQAYISQLETGKHSSPSPDVLERIAVALNVPYLDLMTQAGYIDEQIKDAFEKTEKNSFRKLLGKENDELNFKKFLGIMYQKDKNYDFIFDLSIKTQIDINTFNKIMNDQEDEVEFTNEEVSLIADYFDYPFTFIYLLTNNRQNLFGVPITKKLLEGLVNTNKYSLEQLRNIINDIDESKTNNEKYENLLRNYNDVKSTLDFDSYFKSKVYNGKKGLDLNDVLHSEDLTYKGKIINKKQRELISNLVAELLK